MTANRVLIDSSFLYALYNPAVRQHFDARAFIRRDKSVRLVPDVVLTEVAYLLWSRAKQPEIEAFLFALSSSVFQLIPLKAEDILFVRAIRSQYQDANFDFVDCCLMALAERLDITRVCTFDRRDFAIYRPRHCEYLELEP
jgi:uncharacterized protein